MNMADTSLANRKPFGSHPTNRLKGPHLKNLPSGRHADGNGLYLVVDPSGARRWVLRVVANGRRRDIGLGGLNIVSLGDARELARELRKAAKEGKDPAAERDKNRQTSPTFEQAARKIFSEQIETTAKNDKHRKQWIRSLELYAFPVIGSMPIHSVKQADIVRVLSPIWTEKQETARRIKQRLKATLDWARANGYVETANPVEGVDRGLAPQRKRVSHFEALPWKDLPDFWQRLRSDKGMGSLALQFAILTAARSGEVRGAIWDEIDFEEKVWTIPSERMKAGREHRVPLNKPAVAILQKVWPLRSGGSNLVFPSIQSGKALSDMTLTAVLRRLETPVTVHGFRSTFRDWTEENTTYSHEAKEAALAHIVKNKAEAAYRRTDLFEKRRKLMSNWGSFIAQRKHEGR